MKSCFCAIPPVPMTTSGSELFQPPFLLVKPEGCTSPPAPPAPDRKMLSCMVFFRLSPCGTCSTYRFFVWQSQCRVSFCLHFSLLEMCACRWMWDLQRAFQGLLVIYSSCRNVIKSLMKEEQEWKPFLSFSLPCSIPSDRGLESWSFIQQAMCLLCLNRSWPACHPFSLSPSESFHTLLSPLSLANLLVTFFPPFLSSKTTCLCFSERE